ncbi:hypothetical protein D5085_16175 [Ectothiorhodospiraceae bacterium BW-2]|nr:hypothetical protein D5085_16175 [Ectothiorhodospiraceae bacterium BW-2]
MKHLPIGINTLSSIIDEQMVYIDKTDILLPMAQKMGRYFLSRPRRFGKSLLVDTLKELFEGNRRLFSGLYIEDKWDWSRTFPVIKIDFAGAVFHSRSELDQEIMAILDRNQQRLGIVCDWDRQSIPNCFSHLIAAAEEKYGQKVVILIDEYDKPILDNIEHPDRAAELREGVKNLYSVMKGMDASIQFIFMTGVTKFSKVSIFSGINQLMDITLDDNYATICGYTQTDLETSFAEHLTGVDWEKLKRWYNGYNFLGESVYNPFDILLFIAKNQTYRNYWFETGSPSFLIKLFQQNRYFLPDLEAIEVGEEILDSFDVENIDPITLLFQSGYLTIRERFEDFGMQLYRLGIPNQEVRHALNTYLIDSYTRNSATVKLGYQRTLYHALLQADIPELIATIKRLFASIPWRNFTNNDLPEAEGYYASVLYAFFASLNATIIPEDITNHGQVDLVIQVGGYTYITEIKIDKRATPVEQGEPNAALKQIEQKEYAKKYRGSGKGVFELGLVFSTVQRNLLQADWRAVD